MMVTILPQTKVRVTTFPTHDPWNNLATSLPKNKPACHWNGNLDEFQKLSWCFAKLIVILYYMSNNIPYLFTYKAHSVIRRTLNFRRRLWQVSKIKISPKYPVIRRTQNYGKILLTTFAVFTTICFQKLLITVLSLSKQKRKSHTLQTIAKKVTHRQWHKSHTF